MAIDTPAKIAIIGAGPIGLEAALYARYLGYDVELFESRATIEPRCLPWLRLDRAIGPYHSPLGVRALEAQLDSFAPLDSAETLTIGQWYEHYLLPLAESDLIIDGLYLESKVVAVGKVELRKTDCPTGEYDRGAWDFRLLVEQGANERVATADVVLDCSGRSLTTPLGHGGIWALGERDPAIRQRIWYWPERNQLSDSATLAQRYAGKSVLLVGDSVAAATMVIELSEIAKKKKGTRIVWITRHERAEREAGPLAMPSSGIGPALSQAVAEANALALAGKIDWQSETWVEEITLRSESLLVRMAGAEDNEQSFDTAIGIVGARPDWSFCSELQLQCCGSTETPLTCEIAGNAVSAPIEANMAERFATGEPNYYVLGAKSAGRGFDQGYQHGLRQIRELFAIIGDRADLDLYHR